MKTPESHPFTALFFGDSITDAGRREEPDGLGAGFVRLLSEQIAASAPSVRVINRGIGGDRSRDLLARLEADCIAENPDVVSILVGVNDMWRRFDRADPTSVATFGADYRAMLTAIRKRTSAHIVLCEPFVVPLNDDQRRYRGDLDPKISVVRKLAVEFGATLVELDPLLQRHAGIVGAAAIAHDGVHPTAYGHRVIADAWLRAAAAVLPLSKPAWKLSGFGDEIDDDPRIQTAVLSALGASAIEVRSAWGMNIVDLTTTQLEELATIIADAGLVVSAIASPIGKVPVAQREDEYDRLRAAIAAAKRLGTDRIRLFSFYPQDAEDPARDQNEVVAGMRELARIAAAAEVVLLHENEKDIFGDVPERILRLLAAVDSPALQLAWDSANFVQVGVVPDQDTIELLSPWVDYLQVKDATLEDAAVHPAGEGDGGVDLVVDVLLARGYRGFASLEPHLSSAFDTGGFSGPTSFGQAARAFRAIADRAGVVLQ